MNKNEFRSFAEGTSLSDPKSIANLMKTIYESDIADSFPENMWAEENPFFESYNAFLNQKDYYSETSENRLNYKDIVNDLETGKEMPATMEQDIVYFLSCGGMFHSPEIYNNPNNTNNSQRR